MSDDPRPSRSRLEVVFREQRDRALGRLAVQLGILTDTQVDDALNSGRPLAETLLDRGLIDAEELERLRADLSSQDFAGASSAGAVLPEEARAVATDPSRQVGEFLLVSTLGRGGAGEVWKAWDTSLHRWVALKRPSLATPSATALERFRREAAAVARLQHPHIVPLHRVGLDRDRPYLVFQYVDGKSFEEDRPSPSEAPELLWTVALAVDHAHQQGIVHRDLKPGNLMRDARGRVWVLDFGLAYLREAGNNLTQAGAVIGTAAYMSPEQARGEDSAKLPTTDVYSLGATLFDLVTGRPPFTGTGFAEVVHQVARSDPPRARQANPGIDPDLETVLEKAMSREPGRRYPTAAAMAEDLRRCLAKEPIDARRPGVSRRMAGTLRRRPLLSMLAAVAVCVALGVGLFARIYGRERDAALSTIRETARVSLEAMLQLRRNGQNSGMRAFLPPLEKAYQDAIRRDPDLAEPEYQRGRVSRALLEDARALEFQERAIAKDPQYGPARYERAVLLSRIYGTRYRRALDAWKSMDPGSARTPVRDEVEKLDPGLESLRRKILEDARESGSKAAQGVFAYYQDRPEEARRLLDEALEIDGSREEVWAARASTESMEAMKARDLESKLGYWSKAEEVYGRGLEHDRGYVPHHLGRGEVRLQRAKLLRQFGKDPLTDLARAEEDFSVALSLEPAHAEAWLRRGETRGVKAIHEAEAGREPFAFHDAAEEDLGKAIELDPSAPEAWMRRGLVRSNRAVFREGRKLDGRPDYDAADADLGEALRRDPGYASAWQWRGIGRANRAMAADRRNQDSLPGLDAALADLAQALRLKPDAPGIHLWIGIANAWRAQGEGKLGRDSLPRMLQAERAYGRALELNPDYADAYFWRALHRKKRAALPGAEESVLVSEAENDLSQVIRLNPLHWEARLQRATLRADRASHAGPESARADYDAAAADLREAIRINPDVEPRVADLLKRVLRLSKP